MAAAIAWAALAGAAVGAEAVCTCPTTAPPTTTVTTTLRAPGPCAVPQDVVFVVAATGRRPRDFVQAVLSELPTSSALRAGAVTFGGSGAVDASPLDAALAEVAARLGLVGDASGEVALAPALGRAALMLASGSASTARTVVVVLASPPVDLQTQARTRAAELQAAGAKVRVMWLGSGAPSAIYDLATAPSSRSVLLVPPDALLAATAPAAASMVREPCPCGAGTAADLPSPGGVVSWSPGVELQHGEAMQEACSDHFPGYSGSITLACVDGALRATAACARSCTAGARVTFAVGGAAAANASLASWTSPGALASGEQLRVPCEAAALGAVGAATALATGSRLSGRGGLRLTCSHGRLAAFAESCGLRCAAGMDGEPKLATWRGVPVLLRRFPADGLDHGATLLEPCAEHFGADLPRGDLGVVCLGGRLRAFGACLAPRSCADAQAVPAAWTAFGAFLLAMGLLMCLGSGFAILLTRWRQQEKRMAVWPIVTRMVTVGLQVDDICAPPKACAVSSAQTEPQVYASFVKGAQLPLDVVFVVDSSFSVGDDGFARSVAFLERVVDDLETPPVRAAVIRFSHEVAVVSELTDKRGVLLQRIAAMPYAPGGTDLTAPLRRAGQMLRADGGAAARGRAVVVLTDGQAGDWSTAGLAVQALVGAGVRVLPVCVSSAAKQDAAAAAPGAGPPSAAGAWPEGLAKQLHGCEAPIFLEGYEGLAAASELVLGRIVEVAQWAYCAKASLDWSDYAIVEDIDAVEGFEVMVPGWTSQPASGGGRGGGRGDGAHKVWRWEGSDDVLMDSEVVPWDPSLVRPPSAAPTPRADAASQVDLAPPERALAQELVPTACAGAQTEPVVKVALEPWRQAHLDLVVCLDASIGQRAAALAAARAQRAAPSWAAGAAAAEASKGAPAPSREALLSAQFLIELIMEQVQAPEVRMALVRLAETQSVSCELTADRELLRNSLSNVTPHIGEVRLHSAIRLALELLGERRARREEERTGAGTSSAILVLTDSEPSDMRLASEAAAALRSRGVRLVFVRLREPGSSHWCGDGSRQLRTLAAISAPPARQDATSESVFEVEEIEADMRSTVPRILQELLRVTMRISAARCSLPLCPFEDATRGFDQILGHDVEIPRELRELPVRDVTPRGRRGGAGPGAPESGAMTLRQAVELTEKARAEAERRRLGDRLRASEAEAAALRARLEELRAAPAEGLQEAQEAARRYSEAAQRAAVDAEVRRREAAWRVCEAQRRAAEAEGRLAAARARASEATYRTAFAPFGAAPPAQAAGAAEATRAPAPTPQAAAQAASAAGACCQPAPDPPAAASWEGEGGAHIGAAGAQLAGPPLEVVAAPTLAPAAPADAAPAAQAHGGPAPDDTEVGPLAEERPDVCPPPAVAAPVDGAADEPSPWGGVMVGLAGGRIAGQPQEHAQELKEYGDRADRGDKALGSLALEETADPSGFALRLDDEGEDGGASFSLMRGNISPLLGEIALC